MHNRENDDISGNLWDRKHMSKTPSDPWNSDGKLTAVINQKDVK